MTPKQLAELLEYIKKNNAWGITMYDTLQNGRVAVKYIDVTFDSRDGKVFMIKFRSCAGHKRDFKEKVFRVETQQDLDKVYEFLNRRVKP